MGWYRKRGRHDLPWRLTRDPYAVLVSEVMLQQTQVERVLSYYERWLQRWPRLEDLAQASPADAIREWAGLGYNRRALNLHRLAVEVVERHAGRLPANAAALERLPGIGPYTAGAVASRLSGEGWRLSTRTSGACSPGVSRGRGQPGTCRQEKLRRWRSRCCRREMRGATTWH